MKPSEHELGADSLAQTGAEAGEQATVSIDDAFIHHVGQLGRYQVWLFVVVSVTWLPEALLTFNTAFLGKDPVMEHLWACTDPLDAACAAVLAMRDPSAAFCGLAATQWRWTAPLESIVSDLGLVCAHGWKVQAANSGFFAGFLVGASTWGALSDAYGRRRSMLAALASSAAMTALNAFAPNYWAYFVARCLCGATVSGVGLVAFTLACELVGPSYRGSVGIATQLFWTTGECLLPLVAFLVPHWRHLMLSSAAGAALVLLVAPCVPESPRWLLAQGRPAEARTAMQRIADGNRTAMPPGELTAPDAGAALGPPATLWDTFRVPELRRRQCVMMTAWCAVSLAYYGVSLALDSLGGSLYVNFLLVSVIEFPAYLIAISLVNRVGRKGLTVGSFAICGASCLLCAVLPDDSPRPALHALRTAAAAGGKLGGAAAFILLFVYTTELFPTVVRNVALGSNSSAARVGGVLAPLIVLLGKALRAPKLPFAVFGVGAFVAGALCTSMPETQGQPLLDTLEDVHKQAGTRHGGWQGLQAVDGEDATDEEGNSHAQDDTLPLWGSPGRRHAGARGEGSL